MQKTVSTAEARRRFAEITDEVQFQGHEFLILKNGKEVAKLVPSTARTEVPADLKEWLDEFSERFEADLQELALHIYQSSKLSLPG